MAMAQLITRNEIGIVEIIASIHENALRQAAAESDLVAGIEKRNLDAIHLAAVFLNDAHDHIHG